MRKDRAENYKSFETMLPQGARSRFNKATGALDAADELIPEDALMGTAAELREAMKHLTTAHENLAELMAYRKMIGVD